MLLGNDIKDWRTKVRVELGEYILDINVEETKNYYEMKDMFQKDANVMDARIMNWLLKKYL